MLSTISNILLFENQVVSESEFFFECRIRFFSQNSNPVLFEGRIRNSFFSLEGRIWIRVFLESG